MKLVAGEGVREEYRYVVMIDKDTKVIVRASRASMFHTQQMLPTAQIVAGVTPRQAGREVHGVPVFNTVADAVRGNQRNGICHLHPRARFAADSIPRAAVDAGSTSSSASPSTPPCSTW